MQEKPTVIGILGYGYWGPNLARNFLSLKNAKVKYICDSNPGRLNEAGEKCPGVSLVDKPDVLFEDNEVDAVVVASSAVTHYSLASAALKSGKHVFVEKPICTRVSDGEELVRLAETNHLTLMVGHLMMYHPAVRYMKDYLSSGKTGEILYAYSRRLNLGKVRTEENCLWSLCPHDISVIIHLFGEEPETVIAKGASFLHEGIEDVAFVTMSFPGGRIANTHVSWLDPSKTRSFTVVADKQMLVLDDMSEEKLSIFDKKAYPAVKDVAIGYEEEIKLHFGEKIVPHIEMDEPLKIECGHFLECVKTGEKPLTDGRHGLLVLRVLSAAQKSMEEGGTPTKIAQADSYPSGKGN